MGYEDKHHEIKHMSGSKVAPQHKIRSIIKQSTDISQVIAIKA
jgi:hypothetical protein